MDKIKARDAQEAAAVGLAGRIATGISVCGTAAVVLAGMFGGTAWLVDNIPLLITGLTGIATGGFTSWVAIRRMKMDRGA